MSRAAVTTYGNPAAHHHSAHAHGLGGEPLTPPPGAGAAHQLAHQAAMVPDARSKEETTIIFDWDVSRHFRIGILGNVSALACGLRRCASARAARAPRLAPAPPGRRSTPAPPLFPARALFPAAPRPPLSPPAALSRPTHALHFAGHAARLLLARAERPAPRRAGRRAL